MQNDWLGMTYMALQRLEAFGMSYACAVEVALKMQKVQFAKTLVGKQAQAERLREKLGGGRNLLCCMAHECQAGSDPEIQVGTQMDVCPVYKYQIEGDPEGPGPGLT